METKQTKDIESIVEELNKELKFAMKCAISPYTEDFVDVPKMSISEASNMFNEYLCQALTSYASSLDKELEGAKVNTLLVKNKTYTTAELGDVISNAGKNQALTLAQDIIKKTLTKYELESKK